MKKIINLSIVAASILMAGTVFAATTPASSNAGGNTLTQTMDVTATVISPTCTLTTTPIQLNNISMTGGKIGYATLGYAHGNITVTCTVAPNSAPMVKVTTANKEVTGSKAFNMIGTAGSITYNLALGTHLMSRYVDNNTPFSLDLVTSPKGQFVYSAKLYIDIPAQKIQPNGSYKDLLTLSADYAQ